MRNPEYLGSMAFFLKKVVKKTKVFTIYSANKNPEQGEFFDFYGRGGVDRDKEVFCLQETELSSSENNKSSFE